MGNRITIVCDGRDCKAEHAHPIVHGGPGGLRGRPPGWAVVNFIDEKSWFPCSWDLCRSCVQKIVDLLGLPTGDQLFRADGLGLPGLASRGLPGMLGMAGMPGLPGLDDAPPEPPKHCATCNEPYVGASCYFCPPSTPTGEAP